MFHKFLIQDMMRLLCWERESPSFFYWKTSSHVKKENGGERTRRLTVLLALAFTLALVPAIPAQAKKPLTGTADAEFNLLWPGPQLEIPDWVGTITIDGTEYGIAFFWIGTGKAFEVGRGMASFFQEVWRIYDWVELHTEVVDDEVNQWLEYGEIFLWGYDTGVVSLQNSKYRMNGNVEEAFGDFAVWQGRNVHVSGIMEWQEIETPEGPVIAPHYAPGIFRIN